MKPPVKEREAKALSQGLGVGGRVSGKREKVTTFEQLHRKVTISIIGRAVVVDANDAGMAL